MKAEVKGYKVLILAAGLSSRMKGFKPLLPLGDKTVLEQTISRFLEAGIDKSDILVVIGKRAEEVTEVLGKIGVDSVINEAYSTSDMFFSMKLGLKNLHKPFRGVLISPGDIPLIKPSTILGLIEEKERSSLSIIIPSFNKRRGHPILLGSKIISMLDSYEGNDGLRGFLEEHKAQLHYVEVEDMLMLVDIDKPEDYEKILRLYQEDREP